jgi:hypothetical protein
MKKQPAKYVVGYKDQSACCPLSDDEMLLDPGHEK